MIEIPDLDELSTYSPGLGQQQLRSQQPRSQSVEPSEERDKEEVSINQDPQFNIVEDPTAYNIESLDQEFLSQQISQISVQDDLHPDNQDQGLTDDTYSNSSKFLAQQPTVGNHDEAGLGHSLYSPDMNSKISLALTESSYGVNPQVIEYNTAQALPLGQFVPHNIQRGDASTNGVTQRLQRVEIVPSQTQHSQSFMLQGPPNIQNKPISFTNEITYNENKDRNINNNNGGLASRHEDYTVKANFSLSQQLASPMSQITLQDHTEPSPQLPPPLSSASVQRLTLSNGEEFSSIRRGLATDSKAPAEYTLHIIFTQFVRHAERKLNLCLDYPLMEEPPIVDILAEGVDPQFDKIVASLGYIARKKPKPVIDSVMFWRKSKSEVSSMATAEVERTLANAKSNLSKVNTNITAQISPSNPGINKNSNSSGRSKRSLSLMRTKSFSKITGSHRRNQSASSAVTNISARAPSFDQRKSLENEVLKQKSFYDDQIAQARETAIQADRKSLASIYILCRVLIEVVKQTSSEVIGNDLGDKLEEIVYTQLKTTDPISTSESLVRSSNWNLFAELLGFMSEQRFLSVSDRFIADLEKVPSNIKQEDEPRLHLLIHGMRYIKLTNYPLELFEESAEFIKSLAKFFEKANNESIIFAYCEILSNLILPLANILTAEANHPTWVEAIENIFNKAYRLWNQIVKTTSISQYSSTNLASASLNMINVSSSSNNGWTYSIHLMTSVLTVSRKELFSDTWFKIIEDNIFKLKPKTETEDKTTFIVCVARLVWVYIYRLPDTLNNTIKKLDNLFQLLFFNNNVSSKKYQWINSDTYLLNALVEFIRVVGYQHLNYVLDNVLIKLLKISFNGTSLENAFPEKIIMVIKCYLVILEDYELGEKPVFPTDEVFNARIIEGTNIKKFKKKNEEPNRNKTRLNEFMFIAKNTNNALSHEEICRAFAVLLKLLDSQYGSDVLSSDNSNSPTAISSNFSKSQSPFSAFHFGIDFSYQMTKNLHIELFATLIEAIPLTMVPLPGEKASPSGIQFKNVVEILTRNAVHSNYRVANAAVGALKKLSSRKNPSSLITIFAKIAFQFSEKPNPNYGFQSLNSSEFHRLLKVYVELLNCWLKQFNDIISDRLNKQTTNPLAQNDELMNKDVLNDLYQINYNTGDQSNSENNQLKPSDELEWKTIITVIEEIEGNGLFFLCSQDSKTRHFGIAILKLVEQFDQAIYNITDNTNNRPVSPSLEKNSTKCHSRSSSKFAADVGTRLIHLLENVNFSELIKPFRKELSVPERSRLSKLKNRKNILVKLAESDYGIDSTIWFRLYPKLLDTFFEECPMPVAMCRSIVCVRLVQIHESVYEFSESYKNYTSSIFSRPSSTSPPEVLVNQWKLYLIFACCSLTSTNEQKISFPSQPTHGRKRSMQMFIQHQKITSAKSVFRMVLPFLRSQQPMVRDAVISGLSCININIFKTLLENVPSSLSDWGISKQRDPAEDRLRIEIVHILSNVTDRFKGYSFIYSDEWMIANLVSIVKNVKSFLSLPSVQTDIEFQRLRRYFCGVLENIFIGLQDKADLNKWFPFEARIGCFNFLKEWCGFGDASDITEHRYNTMIKRVIQQKDAASAVAILEIEKKSLQFASLSCMAVLCSGPIKQQIEVPGNFAVISFDISGLMNWIHALFCSDNEKVHDIGKTALRNILTLNLNNSEICEEVIKECYTSQDGLKATESYFTIFVEVFLEHKQLDQIPFDVLCLASFLVGHDNYEVRFSAMKLLKYLEERFFNTSTVDRFTESVCSKTKVVYKKALFDISSHLASVHPEGAIKCISYLTKFFNLVGNRSRRDILSCLLPWVQIVELKDKIVTEEELDNKSTQNLTINNLNSASIMVLNNLFEITVKFSSKISNEVEALWVALGNNANNFDKIIEYIMSNCLERKNALFVEYSRQIIDYLAFSQADPLYIIDKFINNLQPKAMVPPQPHAVSRSFNSFQSFPYIANLWNIIPYNEKDAAFSLGQLSMIFLVDLFIVQNERMIERLPLLLHVAFSLLDHYLFIVQEQAGLLLIHLIHALTHNEPKSMEIIETLRQRDHFKYVWVYDDLNNDKKGARTPKNMDLLARKVLEIFTPIVPSLQDDWSRVSLNWATTCAVRHIACRSFQIFRSLLSFLDQSMLKDMLHRLSNTISDETLDIQGFAMQILMTLNAITAELSSEKLIDFPQLFWSSVACLSTIHEQEFIEVLSTMSKFVSKIDFDSPDTVSCLISTFPPKWEGKFEGLQQIVMVGLRSATAWEPSIKFLDKLNHLKDSEIIGSGDSRLLMSVLANLPRFLHALDSKCISQDIEKTALVLSKMADKNNKQALSRILVSLAKNRFRSKKDFLVQTITTIKNIFFPEYEAQTLVLLLGFLSNNIPWVKLETMGLLKHIFPLVNLQRDEFVGVGADLISPLLRLLLTDYAEPALEVLDEAVIISGSQLDKDVLRMSLGNTSMKKEYEKTATLFGIPDESGWAIPMPAVTAASTRNNVHAVFSTCAVATVVDENDEQNKNEEIHFHLEDYYAPAADYADNVSVSVEEPDASLSNMWAALDDFDSFFTKDTDQNGPAAVGKSLINYRRDLSSHHVHSASVDTKYSASSDHMAPMDSAPLVYDKKASVILNRSLARTSSNTSFKTSLADSIGNTNYANQGASVIAKRSYIPFRNSRNNLKNKNDSFTTPVMPSAPAFDPQNNLSPFSRTSTVTSPNRSIIHGPSSSPKNFPSSDSNQTNVILNENATRFEHLLGGSKKKLKKANKFSPNSSTTSISPDLPSHHYWNLNKQNNTGTTGNTNTPPNSAPSGSVSASKVKEKKRNSQKFR